MSAREANKPFHIQSESLNVSTFLHSNRLFDKAKKEHSGKIRVGEELKVYESQCGDKMLEDLKAQFKRQGYSFDKFLSGGVKDFYEPKSLDRNAMADSDEEDFSEDD